MRSILLKHAVSKAKASAEEGSASVSSKVLKNVYARDVDARRDVVAHALAHALKTADLPSLNDQDQIFRNSEAIKREKVLISRPYKYAFHGFQFLGGGGLATSAVLEMAEEEIKPVLGRLGTGCFNMARNVWQMCNLNKANNSFEESKREVMNNAISAAGNSGQPLGKLFSGNDDIGMTDKDVLPGLMALGAYALRTANYKLEGVFKRKEYKRSANNQRDDYQRLLQDSHLWSGNDQVEDKHCPTGLNKVFRSASNHTFQTLFMMPSLILLGRGVSQAVTGYMSKDFSLVAGGVAQTLGPSALFVGDYIFKTVSKREKEAHLKSVAEQKNCSRIPLSLAREEEREIHLKSELCLAYKGMQRPTDTKEYLGMPDFYQIAPLHLKAV